MIINRKIVKRRFGLVIKLIANKCYKIYFAIYLFYYQLSGFYPLQFRSLIYWLYWSAPQNLLITNTARSSIKHGVI